MPKLQIVSPSATIIHHSHLYPLAFIERMGRISHRSEALNPSDDAMITERFIRSVVVDHGDWSITEHCTATVKFEVDRGLTHELVRHRLFSYTQESTRFVNYTKKNHEPRFIYAQIEGRCFRCERGQESVRYTGQDGWYHEGVHPDDEALISNMRSPSGTIIFDCHADQNWMDAISDCDEAYRAAIERGTMKAQIARSLLPTALAAQIAMTGNLRSWRHFLIMRTTAETHPMMRDVTGPLLRQFQRQVPVLFEDIEFGARQVDNLRLPR